MYALTADVYDLIYSWKDYAGESAQLTDLIRARLGPGPLTLLDVACGTGRHLEFLQAEFDVAGLDLTPEVLAVARSRLPGVPLHQGDMLDFDLGETFDVVTCLFSSIGYARDEAMLVRALSRLARHLSPGGLVVVEPWFTPDAWHPGHVHAALAGEGDLQVARVNTSMSAGRLSIMDMHHLVGTPSGTRHVVERHEMGLFTVPDMMAAFTRAGLTADHDPVGLTDRGLYLAQHSPAI
jgi:SAM-dependent methyltransferase